MLICFDLLTSHLQKLFTRLHPFVTVMYAIKYMDSGGANGHKRMRVCSIMPNLVRSVFQGIGINYLWLRVWLQIKRQQ